MTGGTVERIRAAYFLICVSLFSSAGLRAGSDFHSVKTDLLKSKEPLQNAPVWDELIKSEARRLKTELGATAPETKSGWEELMEIEAQRLMEERKEAGTDGKELVPTSVASEEVLQKLPEYDPDRVQKATEEMAQAFRRARPSSWEDLAKVGGDFFKIPPGAQLPPYNQEKVSNAVEGLASDISRGKPGSWEQLSGMLKPYTKEIPAEVMQNVIANRISQRYEAGKSQDNLSKVEKAGEAGKNLSQAASAASNQAANKVEMFSQFSPPQMQQAPVGNLPAQSSGNWTAGINSPVVAGGGGSAGRGFSAGGGSFSGGTFPNSGSVSGAGAPGAPAGERKPAPQGYVDGSSSASSGAESDTRSPRQFEAASGSSGPPANIFKSGNFSDSKDTASGADKSGLSAEKKPESADPAPAVAYLEIGQIPAGAAAAPAGTAFTINKPELDLENGEAAENAASLPPDTTETENSAGSSSSQNSSAEEPGLSMEAARALVRRWLLAALDVETARRADGPAISRTPASAADVKAAALAEDDAFDVFDFWKISRGARHEAIVRWGASVGLPSEKALLLYHAALAAAWCATFAFAGYTWLRWRAFRRRRQTAAANIEKDPARERFDRAG